MSIDYILVQTDSGLRIGYSAESGWVVGGDGDDSIEPIEEDKVFKAVVLLQSAPDEMLERISQVYARFPAAKPFPLTALLRSTFIHRIAYWAEQAARWYPHLPEDEKYKLFSALSEIGQERWASQKLRQFAQREARRLAQHNR